MEPFAAVHTFLGLLINKMYKNLAHHIFHIHSLMKMLCMLIDLIVEILSKGIIVPFHEADTYLNYSHYFLWLSSANMRSNLFNAVIQCD